jgi:hypothetical protein
MKKTLSKILILKILALASSCNLGEDETYILPRNYTGPVIVIFNKSTGNPEKYNNGKRIYEINKNGILKTQFKFQEGFRDIDYKYSNGKVIRYLWPSDRVWKDTINLNSKYKDSIYSYHMSYSDNLWFIVGKVKDLNLFQKRMDAKWDSLASQK